MSHIVAYVENLTDEELYNELQNHGFPAGPVVTSTRRLYERKLSEILEGSSGHDEQESVDQADEMEDQLTQPVRTDGHIGESNLSYANMPEDPRARPGLSYRPSHSQSDEALPEDPRARPGVSYRPSHSQRDEVLPEDPRARPGVSYRPSHSRRDEALPEDPRARPGVSYRPSHSLSDEALVRPIDENDVFRPRSSWSSSYRGTVNNDRPGPSGLSSVPQPAKDDSFRSTQSYGTVRHTISSKGAEESQGYPARQRWTYSDTSPDAQDMDSRHSMRGLSGDHVYILNRRNPVRRPRQRSISKALLTLFITLVIAAIALSYMVYNAWSENDPYQQIEQDALKIIEEMKTKDKQ